MHYIQMMEKNMVNGRICLQIIGSTFIFIYYSLKVEPKFTKLENTQITEKRNLEIHLQRQSCGGSQNGQWTDLDEGFKDYLIIKLSYF
ncbi:unnamed protein product [Paramecium primaurelia]|uniref:Transmembrane protein n=1 Tax=Paramecium primaurelia TaxID=5886 RepID=A0A8S1NP39_PARPR|nr:unnamed protein product [Paramecium primaurelia]